MDALHIYAIVSANNGRARLTSAGLSEQCLTGELLTICIISAVVTILIPDRTLHSVAISIYLFLNFSIIIHYE